MKFQLTAIFAGLTATALAVPTSSANSHVIHEKRNGEPFAWKRHSRAEGQTILPVRIGLKQRNLEHAERFIDDVSNPSSPNFGKHWSKDKIANTFAPAKETSDRVIKWLADSGHSAGRNWIEFDASVSEAERLFDTEYHFYQDKQSKGYRVACDSYGLPQHVKEHIDFVMPTIQLDGLKPVANVMPPVRTEALAFNGLTGLANCSQLITIECLRAIYDFPVGRYNHSGNKLGIAEWVDYLYLPDLNSFFAKYTKPRIPLDTVPEFISIDGGQRSNLTVAQAGEVIESALDFQTSYSIIWPQQTRLYQNGNSANVNSTRTINNFLDALDGSYCTYEGGEGGYTGPLQCGGAPISNVFSVSYVQSEPALPRFYQQRQCHEWMKLALQGVSVIFAYGDAGVASTYDHSCVNSTHGDRFSPSFPVNCPYITVVGATSLNNNGTSAIYGGEVAVELPNHANPYYSGGGFSDVFEMPSYQANAVTTYLDKYAPKYGSNVFNNSGHARGFPDVSALGLNIATVFLNKTYGIYGTSASAPIFASIVTLLNEERLQAGKDPIGFLNPVMYAHPEMFNDVAKGSNPGCGTQGFPAAPGWDPVTGLGTPNFPKMKEVFLSLP